jgi:hypothetical protein
MIEQAITITDEEIVILGQFFIHKDYSITRKDLLLDAIAKHYRGQRLRIKLLDGENHRFSGFDDTIRYICNALLIPYKSVVFESHNPEEGVFDIEQLKLGIFISVGRHLPEQFDNNLSNAKFIGTTLGRYNVSRLRLAYELDQAFPNDAFITFQSKPNFINDQYRHFGSVYREELEWFNQKTFDHDLISNHYMGMIDWQTACAHYGNIWNKYQIEVVSETDCMDNFWFTEKTANCLATGKPFVLVSGQGSLKRLESMGFKTFGDILDQSYDSASDPYTRIKRLTHSLHSLYTSPSKADLINQLYQTAHQNIDLYTQYCKRQ